jgi:hypothetical protein
MKVGQKVIVRWIAKVSAVGSVPAAHKQPAQLHELDADQLRQVSGGDGGATQLPKGTW